MKNILKMIMLGMIVTASVNVFAAESTKPSQEVGATICDSDLIQGGTTGTTGVTTGDGEGTQE